MNDYECRACGAAIDVESSKCPYCGTFYSPGNRETIESLKSSNASLMFAMRQETINSALINSLITPNELRRMRCGN